MEFALIQPTGHNGTGSESGMRRARKKEEPGWASGLRELYNSVLNEPLPDSFDDILKKLGKGDDA